MSGFGMPRSHGSPSSCFCPSNPFPVVPSASPCLMCCGSARVYTDQECNYSNLVTPSPSSPMPCGHHPSQPPSPCQGTVPLSRVSPTARPGGAPVPRHLPLPPWHARPMGIFWMPGPRCGQSANGDISDARSEMWQSHGEEAAVGAWVATPYLY